MYKEENKARREDYDASYNSKQKNNFILLVYIN